MTYRWLVVALVVGACSKSHDTKRLRVAAASDLARAFEDVGKEFERRTGIAPEFNFGSSGLLAKQIEQGAPLYLFAAANKSFVSQVVKAGRCDASTATMYARGRLVVWTPSGVAPPAKLADLADSRFEKISIANPDHAPYGVAAKQALERVGVWDAVHDRIVLADNVQATLLYARDHNAQAALVALSLATVTEGGTSLPIDASLHDPLDQQMVVCGDGEEAAAAREFAKFVSSPDGRTIMRRYGFLLPEEVVAK